MSESEPRDPKEGQNGADPAARPEATPEESDVVESAPAQSEADPVALAKAEAQRFRDQLLRTAADFDNFRKRSRRENDDANRKGKETALKELLPVFDNLERALTSAERTPDVKAVVDGLKLVMRQFTQTLEKLSVRRVVTVGEPFDPTQHEAIQHVESTEHAAGVVTAEVQAGYLIGEQLIRAAMVVVSKGAPSESSAADSAAADASGPDGEDPPTDA